MDESNAPGTVVCWFSSAKFTTKIKTSGEKESSLDSVQDVQSNKLFNQQSTV